MVEGGHAGLELLAESVSVLETSPARIELARALADHGAALGRAGHRTQARTTLERALDLAHYCGARRIAAQVREELIAAGAKPRREAITGRDALTASELRVARLAAEGRTNREIAQMAKHQATEEEAVGLLRQMSWTSRRQVHEAAADVIRTANLQPGPKCGVGSPYRREHLLVVAPRDLRLPFRGTSLIGSCFERRYTTA